LHPAAPPCDQSTKRNHKTWQARSDDRAGNSIDGNFNNVDLTSDISTCATANDAEIVNSSNIDERG